MKRLVMASASALALLFPASALHASADDTCEPTWRLESRMLSCENRAFLSPGNDTRANLLLLLRDRAGLGLSATPAKPEWEDLTMGRTFFSWPMIRNTFYPQPDADSSVSTDAPQYSGSRCFSLASAGPAFAAAIAANKGLSASERDLLVKARANVDKACSARGDELKAGLSFAWPDATSTPGKAYLGYLKAATAFYLGQWDTARSGFAALRGAPDPWLAETSAYMLARVELNATQDNAFNEWGDLDLKKLDHVRAARSGQLFGDYLKAWPKGQYAASAAGLTRRSLWLASDIGGLSHAYGELLGTVDATHEEAPRLVEEIDSKLLFAEGVEGKATDPILLAAIDLLAMRESWDPDHENTALPSKFSGADLAAQEPHFAAAPELYGFLQAAQAYYGAKDYARVLALIPDDARRLSYTSLAFSRQMLRGMALAARRDPNEAGFWRELMGGARGLWQRQSAELGLALNLERAGKVAEVFAPGSAVQDQTIREILLGLSAGPETLRLIARDGNRDAHERDTATFTLLYKDLTRGRYGDVAGDVKLIRAGATTEGGFWNFLQSETVPAALFTKGSWSDGYACPAIAATAATLAARPADVKARLCLGDFFRLNGFDGFTRFDDPPEKGTLGSYANQFPGKSLARGAIYAAIMNDPRAAPDDRAYALYRAVNCYAPSGSNACGGNEVEPGQRKAWFNRLKKDYPASPWAKKLRYYW